MIGTSWTAPVVALSNWKTGVRQAIPETILIILWNEKSGVKRNNAQSTWNGAGFNGIVVDGPGAPSGNYTITTQSITANSQVPCTSSVMVNRP